MASSQKQRLPRSVQKSLITLKAGIIERCLRKELTWRQGAALLNLAPKSLSRLKRRYLKFGPQVLLPHTPGPKPGSTTPPNQTPLAVQELIFHLAVKYQGVGPGRLARVLEKEHGVKLDQSTIWRILKRPYGRGDEKRHPEFRPSEADGRRTP